MTDSKAELFANSELLVNPMGYWPSFHDATVKEAFREGDVCRVLVHVFEMTDTVDSTGHLVLTKHHLVTIECPASWSARCRRTTLVIVCSA